MPFAPVRSVGKSLSALLLLFFDPKVILRSEMQLYKLHALQRGPQATEISSQLCLFC